MAGPAEHVRAWRPAVPGVTEVFHARFTEHAYPSHTHDAWTLLIVDDGAVRYDLDRHEHGALPTSVTLLPPHVAHDGRSAVPGGFRKRVVYLDDTALHGPSLTGRAVDRPAFDDPVLRRRIDQLHHALAHPGEELAAQSRLAFITERLAAHLGDERAAMPRDPGLAHRPAGSLDARFPEASAWTRPRGCSTPTRRTSCGRSAPSSGSRRTATSRDDGWTSPAASCSAGCRRPRWRRPRGSTTSRT